MLGLCFMLYEALDLFQSCYGNKSNVNTSTTSSSSSSTTATTPTTDDKRNLILASVPEAADGDEDDASVGSFVDVHLGGCDDTQQLLMNGQPATTTTKSARCDQNVRNGRVSSTTGSKVFSISATIE